MTLLAAQGIDDNQPFDVDSKISTLRTLDPDAASLLLTGSISPLPLHKSLVLLDCLKEHQFQPYYHHELLAFANALVFKISNLHFGPEVGVRNPKMDIPVIANWLIEVNKMANDLRLVQGKAFPDADVYLADTRAISAASSSPRPLMR